MRTASITETKNNLSALLDQVRQGHSILILDRNRPVARLEPVTGSEASQADDEARLERLERAGLIRRGKGKLTDDLFEGPLPQTTDGSSVVEALLEDRREGR